MKNVRALAARALLDSESSFIDEALEGHRTASLSRRDRALLTTLVFGVTRHRRTLDWLIDRCAKRVHPEIRQHLRVALFQFRYLDRIPRHAAVPEAVELAKGVSRKAAGFVNAVLRKAADLPLPDNLGVRTSHPDWLINRWRGRLPGLEAILKANNAVLPLTVRTNPLRAPGPVDLEGDPTAHPGFADGHFTVQDETSKAVAPLLAPKPGEQVLDLCAAPGGKTTHLAELMEGRGLVVAVDLPDRIGLVRESVDRLRLKDLERFSAAQVIPELDDGLFVLLRACFARKHRPVEFAALLRRIERRRWRRLVAGPTRRQHKQCGAR